MYKIIHDVSKSLLDVHLNLHVPLGLALARSTPMPVFKKALRFHAFQK